MVVSQENPDDYARLLHGHRMRAGLSQESLARRAKVSPRTIRHLESGGSRPRASTMHALAEALSLSARDASDMIIAASGTNVDESAAARIRSITGQPLPPRQLPPAPLTFTGRVPELSTLNHAIENDESSLWIVSGPGGIGKTWLTLYWSKCHKDDFPDGQLYLNLRGFEPDKPAIAPDEALRQLLASLGVDATSIPRDLDTCAAFYRSLLADKRMLIVLDNVRDAEQVRPLLPGTPNCVTLITSRRDLVSLTTANDARLLRLATFDEQESRRVLTKQLGQDRVSAEPDATASLLKQCAGLPLAVGILAARAAANPRLPLSFLEDELREDSLDVLETDELSAGLRSVLRASCAQLSDPAAELFALLGLTPRLPIAVCAVASLANMTVARARKLLRELVSSNLVDHLPHDHFRMHDLTHLYANERCHATLSEDVRIEALRQLVDHYVYTSELADNLIAPDYQRRQLGEPSDACVRAPISDGDAAQEWFTIEHDTILDAQVVAAQQGWHDRVWKQAWFLRTVHRWNAWIDEDLASWTIALKSVQALDDGVAKAVTHLHFGVALFNLDRTDEAEPQLDTALELATIIDDQQVRGNAYYVKSLIAQVRGDLTDALEHSIIVRDVAETIGHPGRLAEAHNGVGWSRALLGQYEQARVDCEQALHLLDATENVEDRADIWDSLGYIAHHQGQYTDAIAAYGNALEAYRTLNPNSYHVARGLECVGDTYAAMGNTSRAIEQWRQAADCHRWFGRTEQADNVTRKSIQLER